MKVKVRSKFEETIVKGLQADGVPFEYESLKLKYQKKPSVYTPDLVIGNVIIELKGYFDAEDRAKHLLIKEQYPDLDIRFVFYKSKTKIHKASSTTYGDWATSHGFIHADKEIPEEWIREGLSKGGDSLGQLTKKKQVRKNKKS